MGGYFKTIFPYISANVTIPVSGEWTLEEFKEKMESKLRTEAYFIYFHQGVEIEFDDDTLLSELFGPESINDQGVAQVDVFLPAAALVSIKLDSLSERNCKILDEYGEIVTLEPGSEDGVNLKPVGGWVSLLIHTCTTYVMHYFSVFNA